MTKEELIWMDNIRVQTIDGHFTTLDQIISDLSYSYRVMLEATRQESLINEASLAYYREKTPTLARAAQFGVLLRDWSIDMATGEDWVRAAVGLGITGDDLRRLVEAYVEEMPC